MPISGLCLSSPCVRPRMVEKFYLDLGMSLAAE